MIRQLCTSDRVHSVLIHGEERAPQRVIGLNSLTSRGLTDFLEFLELNLSPNRCYPFPFTRITKHI